MWGTVPWAIVPVVWERSALSLDESKLGGGPKPINGVDDQRADHFELKP